jgi:hypothetical protein
MEEHYAKVVFDADWLRQLNLPNIPYPVPINSLETMKESGGVKLGKILYWLQEYSEKNDDEWLDYQEVMVTIAERLTPFDPRPQIAILGDTWSLICSNVDLTREIIAIQRMGRLVAAIQNHGDGRIHASSYRPLDSRAARFFADISQNFIPSKINCLNPDNWDHAVESAITLGQIFASDSGSAYLTYWKYGLGLNLDKTPIDSWYGQRYSIALPPNILATQILINDNYRRMSHPS